MKKILLTLSIACMYVAGSLNAQKNTSWSLDKDHTQIQFKAVYMGINDVYGQFTDYSTTIKTDGEKFEGAEIMVTIKANSLESGNDKRDGHLKSEDFIHAEEYPEITFKSQSFEKTGNSKFKLRGELTIRGVTKTEEFDVDYKGMVTMQGQKRAVFSLNGTINRYDYDVDWNKTFAQGLVVSKEIDIIVEASLVTKAE